MQLKNILLTAILMVGASPVWAQQGGLNPQMQEALRAKMQEKMRETDLDKDGAISHDEFMAQAETRFKSADLNGDDKITPDEAATLRANMVKQAIAQHNAAKGK